MKRLAISDFDGTLSKGYISMEFMDFLFHEQLYNSDVYEKQQQALKDQKSGKISYDEWCRQWGELWAEGMKGQHTMDIRAAAEDFFADFKKNIYSSSYEIINYLKESYDVILLSVGASEVIELAAKELGIEKVISTTLEKTDIYTGKLLTSIHLPYGKENVIKAIEGKKYIGLGDSPGDLEFLKMVNVPIVMNPNDKMREISKELEWLCLNSNHHNPKELIDRINNEIAVTELSKSKLI